MSNSFAALYKSQVRTPGGRQPISLNFKPFGPKNHSMCVAEVPISSACTARAPNCLSSS
jgi:hypothetical protein